ncbi:hypothetical protein [Candidatus Methylobacter favarea]|uniref:hypothetical protein n=1 Tax=Candidatus Methylobacter favarea TaxID=2707345 RepID=UPI00157C92C6|nr:hypothetical protein [Candidatus Methylobacter favarea]
MTNSDRKDLYRFLEQSGCGIYQNSQHSADYDSHHVFFARLLRKHLQKQKD